MNTIDELFKQAVDSIAAGDHSILQRLLQDHPELAWHSGVSSRDPHTQPHTLFLSACENMWASECFELLLPLSDARQTNFAGRTPLMQVLALTPIRILTASVLHRLLAQSDLAAVDDQGHTALMLASARRNWSDELAVLLPLSDPSARNHRQRTAFMEAALVGNIQALRALLSVSELEAWDSDGRTALMLAAYEGHAPAVRFLREAGANVEIKDTAFGYPSWRLALSLPAERRWACVDELSDTLPAEQGQSLLQQAAQSGHPLPKLTARLERLALIQSLQDSTSDKPASLAPTGRSLLAQPHEASFVAWTQPECSDPDSVEAMRTQLNRLAHLDEIDDNGPDSWTAIRSVLHLIEQQVALQGPRSLSNALMFCLSSEDQLADPGYGVLISMHHQHSSDWSAHYGSPYLVEAIAPLLPPPLSFEESERPESNDDGWWLMGARGRNAVELARVLVEQGFVFSVPLQKAKAPEVLEALVPLFELDALAKQEGRTHSGAIRRALSPESTTAAVSPTALHAQSTRKRARL